MSNIQINPYAFAAAGSAGGWVEVGRTTLSSAGTLDITGLPDKEYYMFLNHTLGTGYSGVWFNSDTGTNYSRRVSVDGASDVTAINQTFLQVGEGDGFPGFNVGYITNISDKEKLLMSWNTEAQTGAGGGNAPSRRDFVGKWANTSSVISTMNNYNLDGSALGYFDIGSEAIILGWDSADTHTTGGFWEELDSVELGVAGTSLDSNTFALRKYLWIQMYQIGMTTGENTLYNFNSDTGSNYARRWNVDGGTEFTTAPTTGLICHNGLTTQTDSFFNAFIVNNSSNEKSVISHSSYSVSTGDSSAPSREEHVGKWDNTSSQISSIQFEHNGNNFGAGSMLKVWGHD